MGRKTLWKSFTRSSSLSLSEYANFFTFGGLNYPLLGGGSQTLGSKQEEIPPGFEGRVNAAYKSNGVIFACMTARQLLFAEASFQFQRQVLGRPGSLFGTPALKPLEEPWPGGTTSMLLSQAIQDVDLGGNFFGVGLPGDRIQRLRPDWTTVVLGSQSDPDAGYGAADLQVLGYIYEPGGKGSSTEAEVYFPEEIVHWAPIPDPLAAFRGMSWITPIVRELLGDNAATDHKLKFFENGATPNMVVSLDANIEPEAFNKWVELFEESQGGVQNAFKTLYLGAGASAQVVGTDLKNVEFKAVQGAGETRICAAARVPPIIVGLSEGLESATYSNYGQARRAFADLTMRPLWKSAAGAFSSVIKVPPGARLSYDDRDIPFLQEDQKDEAEIQKMQAETANRLVEAGFTPESIVKAITSNDMGLLDHSGLVSIQLQEPGSKASEEPSQNGNGAVLAPIGE